jgi:hypothetical protein
MDTLSLRAALFGLVALVSLCLAAPAFAGDEEDDDGDAQRPIVWGEEVKSDTNVLGDLMPGSKLRYKIKTQYASLETSDVQIELVWFDTAKQKDASQILFERSATPRLEQYSLKWIPAEYTLNVSYNCPTRRGDEETMCTERWLWKGGARRFKYIKTTSNNPIAESQDAIITLIRAGKMDRAAASIKATREKYGAERISGDALFVAYFEELVTRARGLADRGQGPKAAAAIEAFVAKPPITSSERCPDKAMLLVCLEDRPACGCNDPFGLLAATERNVANLERLGVLLNKEGKHALTLKLLRPALDHFSDRPRLVLTLADAAWGSGDKENGRDWYKRYIKLQGIEKKIPVVRSVQRAEDAPR